MPAWQRALTHAHLMLYDVHWTPAIVTEVAGGKGGLRVGLADGRTLPLSVRFGRAEAALKLNDVVYVKLIGGSNKTRFVPSCASHRRCRARPSCWKTRPARFWR